MSIKLPNDIIENKMKLKKLKDIRCKAKDNRGKCNLVVVIIAIAVGMLIFFNVIPFDYNASV